MNKRKNINKLITFIYNFNENLKIIVNYCYSSLVQAYGFNYNDKVN
jgi:cystathionine beta-lyase family protein involved in aluminum resistance